MGLTLLTAPAAPATAAGGFGFAPEPLQELLIRGEEVNSCRVSPTALCSSQGADALPGSLQRKPRVLLGHRRGSGEGRPQAESRDGPGCCRGMVPAWHRPQGRGAGVPAVAHPACRRMPNQPRGQHGATAGTRGCFGGRHQAAEGIWVSFFPCNPSVLNFFGGFTPNSSDSTANALQSSAQLAPAAAQLRAACNQSRGKGKYQPNKFTNK